MKDQQQKNQLPINVNSKKKGKMTGNKVPFDDTKFKEHEKVKKTSQAAIARVLGVSQSTVWRWKKQKYIRKHTNTIKPLVNDKNKLDKLIFCLISCILDEHTNNFTFNDMSNVVHIDEKLFYITRTDIGRLYFKQGPNYMHMYVLRFRNSAIKAESLGSNVKCDPTSRTQQIYYLTLGEVEQHREIQSKRFVPKIMFMCAIARPIFSNEDDDIVFREAATLDGFSFHLVQQPPNSPDMNLLDLRFFRSIQALQHQKLACNYAQLVMAVNATFESLQPNVLKFV
ncbi:uncharacterized protein LOC130815059 [Amaranthus tricolor]|uniref:uncharacterized protein LOC130815059 n=1 Tax=Amaranthus tricolor TaxID=29722 RepID=UPI00258681D4|nr:uncharacterized protein LOC130815059 [Amaranthus tricolor]